MWAPSAVPSHLINQYPQAVGSDQAPGASTGLPGQSERQLLDPFMWWYRPGRRRPGPRNRWPTRAIHLLQRIVTTHGSPKPFEMLEVTHQPANTAGAAISAGLICSGLPGRLPPVAFLLQERPCTHQQQASSDQSSNDLRQRRLRRDRH